MRTAGELGTFREFRTFSRFEGFRGVGGAGVLVTAMALLTAMPAAASVGDDRPIVIRTYDASPQPGDRTPALAAAAASLDHAGVPVTWISCDGVFVRPADNPCLTPLTAATLAVRIVRLPPSPGGAPAHVALGDSLVDTHLRLGSLATIYLDRVEALARRCGIDVSALLGRAIAHEVGHLLLGTREHARRGLMRGVWSQQTLRRDRADDWTFTPEHARAMREAVRARTARQMAAGRIGE